MKTRTLGQDLVVSEQGLGCMGMSEFYGRSDEDEAIATIQRALELGVTLLDTADMYGPFTNEKLVGRAIAGRREQVALATKFGNERREDGSWVGINGKPDYVRSACEAPIGRGFLSGKYKKPEDLPQDDFRRHHPRFQGENFEQNLRLVERIEQIAREKQVTASQLALAWVLAQGDDIVPIPGTKRRSYLQENVAAGEIVLSEDDLARIDNAAPAGATAGPRYANMSTIDV
jgi:aryl-alcohol dehydrogenase-like predicted oxidoreductase